MINETPTPEGQQYSPNEVLRKEAELRADVAFMRKQLQDYEAENNDPVKAKAVFNPEASYPTKVDFLTLNAKEKLPAILDKLRILALYYNHEPGDGKPLELSFEQYRQKTQDLEQIQQTLKDLDEILKRVQDSGKDDSWWKKQRDIYRTLEEKFLKIVESRRQHLPNASLQPPDQLPSIHSYQRIAERMVAQQKGFPTELTEKREAELQAERERFRPEGTQQTMTDSLASQDKTQEAIRDDAHDYLVKAGLTDYEAALPKDLVRLMRDEGKELIEIPAETALRVSARVFRQIEALTATLAQKPEFKPVDEKVLVEAFQAGTQMFQDSQGLNEFYTEKTGSYGGIIDPRVRGEYAINLLKQKYNLSDVSIVPVIVAFAAGAGLLVGYSNLNYDLQYWLDGRVSANTAREVQQRIAGSLQSDMAIEYKFTQRFALPELTASQNASAPATESPFAIRVPTQKHTSPTGQPKPVVDATQNQSSGAAFNPFAVRNTSQVN